jgi:outer membrane lipoprotein-sorting protein
LGRFTISSISAFFACLLFTAIYPALASQLSEENQVFNIVKKMQAAFKEVEDYTCEVEQIFYQEGVEDQHYRFKYYFKKKKRIRIDFYYPYPTLSFFYTGGEKEVTAVPFRPMGLLKFRLSVDNPKIRTLTGQKIYQTDMAYFIEFLFENLKKVPQENDEFEEDTDQVNFWFQALDFIHGKKIERYRIFISKENWLPNRIERYTLEQKPIELSIIKNYTINTHLDDKLFIP